MDDENLRPLGDPNAPAPSPGSPPLSTRAGVWLRAKLARVTSTGRLIPELEGLRFVAILSVVLFHVNGTVLVKFADSPPSGLFEKGLASFLTAGDAGVRLFFVISGMILSLPFAERHLRGGRRISLRKYFLRRLTRLEPPYIINLLLVTGLLVFAVHKYAFPEIAGNLAASLVYLHNLIFGDWSKINRIAWSLEVEVQFYVLAPLLSRVFLLSAPVRRTILVSAIVLVCLVNGFLVPAEKSMYTLLLPYYIHYFLTGILLTDLFIVGWSESPTPLRRWDLIGIIAWLAMAPVRLNPFLNNLVFPVLTLLAYIGAFRGPLLNALFRRPWLVTIGGMCYTIYLYHAIVITTLATPLQTKLPVLGYLPIFLTVLSIALPATLVVSAVLFVTCEKPFMRRDWPKTWAATVRGWTGGRRAGAPLVSAPQAGPSAVDEAPSAGAAGLDPPASEVEPSTNPGER